MFILRQSSSRLWRFLQDFPSGSANRDRGQDHSLQQLDNEDRVAWTATLQGGKRVVNNRIFTLEVALHTFGWFVYVLPYPWQSQ